MTVQNYVLLFLQEPAGGVAAWYASKAEADAVIQEKFFFLIMHNSVAHHLRKEWINVVPAC